MQVCISDIFSIERYLKRHHCFLYSRAVEPQSYRRSWHGGRRGSTPAAKTEPADLNNSSSHLSPSQLSKCSSFFNQSTVNSDLPWQILKILCTFLIVYLFCIIQRVCFEAFFLNCVAFFLFVSLNFLDKEISAKQKKKGAYEFTYTSVCMWARVCMTCM